MPTEIPPVRNVKKRPWWLPVALVAALVGGGIYLWEEHLEDHIIPKRWRVVEEGLIYRSGQLPEHLARRVFPKHRLKLVVSLNGGTETSDAEAAMCKDLGIEHVQLPLRGDGSGSIEHYANAIALMHRAVQTGEPMLVHCAAGAKRTGGVVACYRLLLDVWSSDRVINEMSQYDWDRDDVEVIDYVNNNIDRLVELIVNKGIISSRPRSLPSLRL